MVRPLQNDRTHPGRNCRRVQRPPADRETEYRRESAHAAQIRHSRHSDADSVQERHRRGAKGRRPVQITTGNIPGSTPVRGYLGNQGRNRPNNNNNNNKGPRHGNRDGNRGNGRPDDQMLPDLEPIGEDDAEIISPADLAASRKSMNLTELKAKPIHELVKMAESMGLESVARSRKQDIIFSILKAHARNGEDIYGDGVLEILQDGFGFLRSADGSYLAGPDDIYVSPSQIRRFNLRTGDTISGLIRPPKDGERYFALLKVGEINFDSPDSSRNKVL